MFFTLQLNSICKSLNFQAMNLDAVLGWCKGKLIRCNELLRFMSLWGCCRVGTLVYRYRLGCALLCQRQSY